MTEIREFNKDGLDCFRQYLRQEIPESQRPALLSDSRLSSPYRGCACDPFATFTTRFEAGVAICAFLGTKLPRDFNQAIGMWAWLTLQYVEPIAPSSSSGQRKFNKDESLYIPSTLFARRYRHLYRSAALFVDRFGERAKILLSSTKKGINHSKLTEDISARQDIMCNPGALDLFAKLYNIDTSSGTLPKNVISSNVYGTRSIIRIFQQLEKNYDLFGDFMDGDQLYTLLPRNVTEPLQEKWGAK
jgi:hypothetical protein